MPPQAPGKGAARAPQAPGAASDAGAAAPGLAPAHSGADPANGGKSIAGQIGAFAAGWGGQQVLGAVTGMINAIPGRQREAGWVGSVGGGLLGGASAGAALGGTVGSDGGADGTIAEVCRLSYSRVQRELKAGVTGVLLRDKVHGGWIYPEYSALKVPPTRQEGQRQQGTTVCGDHHFRQPSRWGLPQARPLRRHLPVHAQARGLDAPSLATDRLLPSQRRRHRPAQRPSALSSPQDAPSEPLWRGKPLPDRWSAKKHHPEILALQRFVDWEKGSVEHANGLLRFWFPKGIDFSKVFPAGITRVQNHLNAIFPNLLPERTHHPYGHKQTRKGNARRWQGVEAVAGEDDAGIVRQVGGGGRRGVPRGWRRRR